MLSFHRSKDVKVKFGKSPNLASSGKKSLKQEVAESFIILFPVNITISSNKPILRNDVHTLAPPSTNNPIYPPSLETIFRISCIFKNRCSLLTFSTLTPLKNLLSFVILFFSSLLVMMCTLSFSYVIKY